MINLHIRPKEIWEYLVEVAKLKVKMLVAQSCLTVCNPMDCSPSGSSIHRTLLARTLEWVPFPSPGDLPDPGIKPGLLTLQAGSLPSESQGKSKSLQGWYFSHEVKTRSVLNSGHSTSDNYKTLAFSGTLSSTGWLFYKGNSRACQDIWLLKQAKENQIWYTRTFEFILWT